MTYCFKCRDCGASFEGRTPGTAGELDLPCVGCGGPIVRDYRAEAVGIGSGVRASKQMSKDAAAELFLPTNDDFASPSDPDGKKGMREWRDSHAPRESNKRPHWPGSVEKKVLAGFTGKEK